MSRTNIISSRYIVIPLPNSCLRLFICLLSDRDSHIPEYHSNRRQCVGFERYIGGILAGRFQRFHLAANRACSGD